MASWYAYCVSERSSFPELDRHRRPVPLAQVSGIAGNQVFLFPASDLAVVVSECEDPASLDPKSARDHAQVVSACFQQRTVLPFRFGTVFSDDDSLRRSVRSNHRQFVANLARLRGKAEMHLKVVVDDTSVLNDKPMPRSAGREYLNCLHENAARLRERQTKARAVFSQMHRMFSPLDEEISCKRMDSGKMLLDIAHLIDHQSVQRYQNKYSTAAQTLKDCRMQLTGPWPPYHFVHKAERTRAMA